jgi:hypothetical protein
MTDNREQPMLYGTNTIVLLICMQPQHTPGQRQPGAKLGGSRSQAYLHAAVAITAPITLHCCSSELLEHGKSERESRKPASATCLWFFVSHLVP